MILPIVDAAILTWVPWWILGCRLMWLGCEQIPAHLWQTFQQCREIYLAEPSVCVRIGWPWDFDVLTPYFSMASPTDFPRTEKRTVLFGIDVWTTAEVGWRPSMPGWDMWSSFLRFFSPHQKMSNHGSIVRVEDVISCITIRLFFSNQFLHLQEFSWQIVHILDCYWKCLHPAKWPRSDSRLTWLKKPRNSHQWILQKFNICLHMCQPHICIYLYIYILYIYIYNYIYNYIYIINWKKLHMNGVYICFRSPYN